MVHARGTHRELEHPLPREHLGEVGLGHAVPEVGLGPVDHPGAGADEQSRLSAAGQIAQAGGGGGVGLEAAAGDLGEHADRIVEVQAHALDRDGLPPEQSGVVHLERVRGPEVDQPMTFGGVGELL